MAPATGVTEVEESGPVSGEKGTRARPAATPGPRQKGRPEEAPRQQVAGRDAKTSAELALNLEFAETVEVTGKREVRHKGRLIGSVELGITTRLYEKSNYQILFRSILLPTQANGGPGLLIGAASYLKAETAG